MFTYLATACGCSLILYMFWEHKRTQKNVSDVRKQAAEQNNAGTSPEE